jgi:hypothetical protein
MLTMNFLCYLIIPVNESWGSLARIIHEGFYCNRRCLGAGPEARGDQKECLPSRLVPFAWLPSDLATAFMSNPG